MSESDDTDFLLLIPPDYFITLAEDRLRALELRQHKLQFRDNIHAVQHCLLPQISNYFQEKHKMNEDCIEHEILPSSVPTVVYQYLAPGKKSELNSINSHLRVIEREDDHHFASPSDVSTISNGTVAHYGLHRQHSGLGVVHSTPKSNVDQMRNEKRPNGKYLSGGDDVLLETDNFLEDRQYNSNWNHHSDGYQRTHHQKFISDLGTGETHQATSLPGALNRLSDGMPERQSFPNAVSGENNLISLSEIWGKSGQATTIACTPSAQTTALKEEHLRRQHLERTVHALQSRLLEYQQRISVAIEVDRSKDAALSKSQLECKSLTLEVQQLRDSLLTHQTAESEHCHKLDALQKELTQAVSLAAKYQEKNEKLETIHADCSRKNAECTTAYRKQVEEFEIKLHASKRAEEYTNNELSKLKDKHAKAEYQNEKLKVRCDELEKDNETLKNQKEMLQEFHQKQKTRADALETQRKSLQESLGHLTENEMTLKKKLDIQQKTLKSHYQQQLENVVAQKLKEFQEQLDKTEENLRKEAHERERLIAERAVKQLELINEKNELELNLMQEKHNEEVELYRIQLANASKKIDELELKLNVYKTKRADIAEKLHDVMETQWQKALEILTSPSNKYVSATDANAESPEDNSDSQQHYKEHETTPKTTKSKQQQTMMNTKENNLNIGNNKLEQLPQPEPMDRLQAYIQLLLSKSPSDVDKLHEILALSTKTKATAGSGKYDKTTKRFNNTKPPWKA